MVQSFEAINNRQEWQESYAGFLTTRISSMPLRTQEVTKVVQTASRYVMMYGRDGI